MKPVGPFSLPRDYVLFHNHELDPVTAGKRLRRLPDLSLVPAEEYAARLQAYLEEHPDADRDESYQSTVIRP